VFPNDFTYTVTDQPETIQIEKSAQEGIKHYGLKSTPAAKPAIPKQIPGNK
jgi:hypothetical protein